MSKKLKIEKSKKSEKWNISGREKIDSQTAILKGPHTEIFGNSCINIDGCSGVEEYRDTYVKIRLCKGSIILYGKGFDIAFFENKLITVKGEISSLEFCV